jgi:hypothetical protein
MLRLGLGHYRHPEGNDNTAVGFDALHSGGDQDTAVGSRALQSEENGAANTAIGFQALAANRHGLFNTAIGDQALSAMTGGVRNTAVGSVALANSSSSSGNTAVGGGALVNDTTGANNTALGDGAGSNVTTASNVICIGAAGNNVSNSCYIGTVFGASSSGGTAVFINSNGRLGTVTSSRRFKDEIKPMARVSETLFSLQPVTFRYKKEADPEGTNGVQFGLVAEDVEKVNRDLIVRDKEGKPYSVRYDQVNAMLLNEFLKEHRKVEKQEATITELKAEIGTLSAMVKTQAEQMQKVSSQLEVSKAAPQTVLNGQ